MAIQDQQPTTIDGAAPAGRVAGLTRTPPNAPVSWDDFLAWLDEDDHAEWVAGEIIEMPPATDEHQELTGFLYVLVLLYVQRNRLGRVFQPPFLLHLPTRPSGREPDLLFISTEHASRVQRTFIDGPADLVVEVVSRDSTRRDRQEKRVEYAAAGIPEYWLIDPLRQDARFYQLDDQGTYHAAHVDADGVFTSRIVPGFRLRVSWLWQRPLLTIDEALADLSDA